MTTQNQYTQRLGDFVNIRTGKLDANANVPDGEYPFFTCAQEPLTIDKYAYNCECVLVAGNGDLNVKYYNGKFEAYQRTYIVESKDKINLDVRYLYHFLNSYLEHLRNSTIGGVIQYIRLANLTEIPTPVPPLPEQKRIAIILDKADAVRCKRQEAIRLANELLRSVFLDMFGDPEKNPKEWNLSSLEDVCEEIYRYPTFYGFDYALTGIPVARIGNILLDGFLDPDLSHYVFIEPKISKDFPRTILELNDIVMAVRGDGSTAKRIGLVNSQNLVGANISPNLLRFKAKDGCVDPMYLFHFMVSEGGQNLLEKNVTRTAKKTITARDIKNIQIPVPAYSLQKAFAKVFNKFERTKSNLTTSYQESCFLFNSLVQRAFRGEL